MKKSIIEIWLLNPPHSPNDSDKVNRLEESMKQGWTDRPLLVEQLKPLEGLSQRYEAWTGSHRIAAAKKRGLESVPCLIITLKEAKAAIDHGGYNQKVGYSSFRNAISGHDGCGDMHKLDALEKVGLFDAAEIMRIEIDENEQAREKK